MHIDTPLVRCLIATQFPQWASLAVEQVDSAGFDNTIFRLGRDLAVRLPRRRVGAEQVGTVHQWLPVLAPHLPVAVPVPLGHGVPNERYPWPWTVCPWLEGEIAALAPVADSSRVALSLARFIAAIQAIDPAGGPVHEFRGISLAAHERVVRTSAALLQDSLDIGPVIRAWEAAMAAAPSAQPVWMHGDLHPANLLIDRGELSAVIDFGLLGVGDPACDLIVAWTYLANDSRGAFRGALAVDDATWSRGRGWALRFGLMAAAYSADNPVLAEIGRYTVAEVMTDIEQAGARH